MTAHEEQIRRYHAALHRLCGLPALSPTISDLMAWHDFLAQMKPLDDTEGGPFTIADLTAVLSLMAKQKREGIPWSMRPTLILRDPERFRDMVLESRRRLRKRPPAPITEQRFGKSIRQVESAHPDNSVAVGPAAASAFADLRKKAGL